MAKDILDIFNLDETKVARKKSLKVAYPDPEGNSLAIDNEFVSMPKCPKCNKIPLKCPNPDDCGMENL